MNANGLAMRSAGLKSRNFQSGTNGSQSSVLWFKVNKQNPQIGDLAVGEVEALI